MEENKDLLKYIYHEDLYIVDEPAASDDTQIVIEEEIASEPGENKPSIVQETKPVIFFGSNEKGILILVNDLDNDFLNQKEMDFLMTIIEGGLKLTKIDFALVNIAKYPYSQVLDELHYNYIVSFDETQKSNPRYQVIVKDNKKMLFAENLSAIEADREKKKLLWKALKAMFDL
ncbi:MAG: hypothetical protein KAI29_12485 [Cyclobacteriaceae bacterium]|nr:hypothetical protein [Cyclobacteriaceae bacterium]